MPTKFSDSPVTCWFEDSTGGGELNGILDSCLNMVIVFPPSMPKAFNRLCEETLIHWLEGRKKFKLLFESGNSKNIPHDFHKHCDRKGPTVSIFVADNSLFGGYTSTSWHAKPSGSKQDRDAFVFKLYDRGSFNPRKYDTDDHSCSIYCHPLYGPTFGGGDDANARRDIETKHERRSPNGRDIMKILVLTDLGQTYNSQRHHRHERLVYNSLSQVPFQVYQIVDDKDYLPTPWTQITDENDKMKAEIEEYCLSLGHVKILLVGQGEAGQSSYIHSIRSAFKGYVTSAHNTEVASRTSTSKMTWFPETWKPFTYWRKEHQIRSGGDRTFFGLRFCETQGLEAPQETAPGTESFRAKFALWIHWLIDSYKKRTDLKSKHGIVFVIDGSVIDDLPRDVKREFDQWKDIANKYKIPQTVVLTKIDLVCSLADKDLSLTFQSSKIADLVGKAAELMGLPRSHIFPVKNYVEEIELEEEADRLTLFSLRQMLRFIQDRQDDSLQRYRPDDIV